MGTKSDAKRKAQLKERRKKAETQQARILAAPDMAYKWVAAHDAEPNVIVELMSEEEGVLAYIEGDCNDTWTVVVADEAVAGTNDEFVALSWFLCAAADDMLAGNTSTMAFSSWFVEEIEKRCETSGMKPSDFLSSLLPTEKKHMALPELCVM